MISQIGQLFHNLSQALYSRLNSTRDHLVACHVPEVLRIKVGRILVPPSALVRVMDIPICPKVVKALRLTGRMCME